MSEDVIVRDNPEHHRFDLLVDGVQAGFSLYTEFAESAEDPENPAAQRIFHHTVVDEAFGGRGLAGVLTREALTASVAAGHRIVPVCPFVVRWLRDHHEVDGSVDRVRPAHLEAVRRADAAE